MPTELLSLASYSLFYQELEVRPASGKSKTKKARRQPAASRNR